MSEQLKNNGPLSPGPDEQDVVALIKKMQQQLVFLEKKIDVLIGQSSGRPSSENHFSKPFRSFGRPNRPFDRAHGDASGEKKFDHKKKVYGDSRESHFGQDRHFARRNDGQKAGFDPRKKSFLYNRKGRG
jgi:hypothetical protein